MTKKNMIIEYEIGSRVRRMRENRDMSMDELANRLNLSVSSVSRLENGKQPCTLRQLLLLSKIFEITVDELLGNGPILSVNQNISDTTKIPAFNSLRLYNGELSKKFKMDYRVTIESVGMKRCFFYVTQTNEAQLFGIMKNDYLLIEETRDFESGDIVLVAEEGREATLYKLFLHDTTMFLQTAGISNDRKLSKNMRILGRLIKIERKM